LETLTCRKARAFAKQS